MNSNNITKYGGILLLELILKSEDFLNAYIDKFVEMQDSALSFSVDPECSCKDKIIEHYTKNSEVVADFIGKYISRNPSVIDIKDFLMRHESIYVSGKIFKIEKNEKAYSDFITKIKSEGWHYREMSVAVDADSYTIFFS